MSSGKTGRPKCLRKVESLPQINYFKPRGIPLTQLEKVELRVEELEAIKQVHLEGNKRGKAAMNMGVSRRTLGRELKSGLRKVADALLNGKAIEIKGGYYVTQEETVFKCLNDKHVWKAPKEGARPQECPECGSNEIKIT